MVKLIIQILRKLNFEYKLVVQFLHLERKHLNLNYLYKDGGCELCRSSLDKGVAFFVKLLTGTANNM